MLVNSGNRHQFAIALPPAHPFNAGCPIFRVFCERWDSATVFRLGFYLTGRPFKPAFGFEWGLVPLRPNLVKTPNASIST